MHVTLLATTAKYPNASYFLPTACSDAKVPQAILTKLSGPINPEFNSVTYNGTIQRPGQPVERIEKIFSRDRVEDEWLGKVFGAGRVGWVYRKEWDAYPVQPPTATYPSLEPAPGIYYVNAFEPVVSTMETETISSLNIVDLLLQHSEKVSP